MWQDNPIVYEGVWPPPPQAVPSPPLEKRPFNTEGTPRLRIPNLALQKPHVVNGRVYDYNTEGWANYGLTPDALQDARNVGATAADLDGLFTSAGDYIETWGKAQRVGGCAGSGVCVRVPSFVCNEQNQKDKIVVERCAGTCPLSKDAGAPSASPPPMDVRLAAITHDPWEDAARAVCQSQPLRSARGDHRRPGANLRRTDVDPARPVLQPEHAPPRQHLSRTARRARLGPLRSGSGHRRRCFPRPPGSPGRVLPQRRAAAAGQLRLLTPARPLISGLRRRRVARVKEKLPTDCSSTRWRLKRARRT